MTLWGSNGDSGPWALDIHGFRSRNFSPRIIVVLSDNEECAAAALSPEKARQAAVELLAQADACERDAEHESGD